MLLQAFEVSMFLDGHRRTARTVLSRFRIGASTGASWVSVAQFARKLLFHLAPIHECVFPND